MAKEKTKNLKIFEDAARDLLKFGLNVIVISYTIDSNHQHDYTSHHFFIVNHLTPHH